jgi:hypothetical protein
MNEIARQDVIHSVQSILNNLKISKVVYVDDKNVNLPIENVLGVIKIGNMIEEIRAIIPSLSTDDPDIIATQLRQKWDGISYKKKFELHKKIETLLVADKDDETDFEAISVLNDLIPQKALLSLSPEEWTEKTAELLSGYNETLFLFDQQLDKTGASGENGINLIEKLLRIEANCMCGLLTHTITPEQIFSKRFEMAKDINISADRFFIIPKLNLVSDPILFVYYLKYTILARDFTKLKANMLHIISCANKNSEDFIESIDIQDFDHIIFKVPIREGLWEPDMFFRIYNSHQRRKALELAYQDISLKKITNDLRTISNIPAEPISVFFPRKIWELQHDELYETPNYLNINHLPLELGDIFEQKRGGNSKRYILLTQPCDLMIREKGYRTPEVERFPIIEIIPSNEKQEKSQYEEEIPYFDVNQDNKWNIKFKRVRFVRSIILDLCTFNDDGIAKYKLNSTMPEGMRLSMQERYKIKAKIMNKEMQKRKETIEKIKINESVDMDTVNEIRYNIITDKLKDDFISYDLTELENTDTLLYDLKRIGRLDYEKSTDLLMKYASIIERPALDVYYGNKIE